MASTRFWPRRGFKHISSVAVAIAVLVLANSCGWRLALNGVHARAAPSRARKGNLGGFDCDRRRARGWASAPCRLGALGGTLPDGEARDAYPAQSSIEYRDGIVQQFAATIYRKPLSRDGDRITALNERLIQEAYDLRESDAKGRDWSAAHYKNGYTSYGSQRSLNRFVNAVVDLEEMLEPHVRSFRSHANMMGPKLIMTDCWISIMGAGGQHGIHQHGDSILSGTYYVQTPDGCPGISFEDPRLDRTVATRSRLMLEYPVKAGEVVFFESWLRHNVVQNQADGDRIAVSFNYHSRFQK